MNIEKIWKYGESDLGYSVYKIGPNKWSGEITVYHLTAVLPAKDTKEELMKNAEVLFNKLYESYHEVVN